MQLGNFGTFKKYVFPTWSAAMLVIFVFCETRKQYFRFFTKDAARMHIGADLINESGANHTPRLMPRTEDLIIYGVSEFNMKVLDAERGRREGTGLWFLLRWTRATIEVYNNTFWLKYVRLTGLLSLRSA